MALYHEDIVNIELNNGQIFRSFMSHTIGSGDNMANRFGVRAFRNGEPENIGGNCFGLFIRADGTTVLIENGEVSGNEAYVTLPEACYAVEGQFSMAIKCQGGGVTGTLRIVDGVVSRTSTSTAVDPGEIIPSISALIEAIDAAVASIPPDYSDLVETVEFGGLVQNMIDQSANRFDATNSLPGYWNNNGYNQSTSWRASADYIPVYSNGEVYVNANYNGYLTFYTGDKEFITSTGWTINQTAGARAAVAVPANAVFCNASIVANSATQAGYFYILLDNSIDIETVGYSSYARLKGKFYKPGKEFYIVNQNPAYGDFTTVQAAVDASSDGAVILIMPGTYTESVSSIGKTIHLIGLSKENTFIVSNDDRRDYPALEMTAGSATGISFYSLRGDQPYPAYATPYGAHIDYDQSAGKSLTFKNCAFRSEWNAAVGIGMRAGFSLTFEDCVFTSISTNQGALYFHDSSNETYAGSYEIKVLRCIISNSGNYAVVVMPIGYEDNNFNITMIGNAIYSNNAGVSDTAVHRQDPGAPYPVSTGTKWLDSDTMTLNPLSFGNNVQILNYR